MRCEWLTGEFHSAAEESAGGHVEVVGASAAEGRVHGRLQVELLRFHANAAKVGIASVNNTKGLMRWENNQKFNISLLVFLVNARRETSWCAERIQFENRATEHEAKT